MFRFYKITRFANGTQHVDVGELVDLDFVTAELEVAPLEVDLTYTPAGCRGPWTVTEFLVYEG